MDKATQEGSPPWCISIEALISFDTIERLCSLGEKMLNAELDKLHEAMDRDYETLKSEHNEDAYLRHVNDEYLVVSETLPCLHWYSQFLITYSLFEMSLNAFAVSYRKKIGTPIRLKDMSGQGIIRARNYLSKVCGVTEPFNLPEWQTATLLSEMRNAIAHRSGFVDYCPSDERSLYCRLHKENIDLKRDLAGQKDARIVLTADAVSKYIKVFRVLLSEIGGHGREFVTPKHGLPSGEDDDRSW